MTKVFVIDAEGKPLLPCHPARARRLLKHGKAVVYSVVPFTIKLNKVIDNPAGEFTAGIDDGAKKAGIAVVNEHTKEVVFVGEIKLRNDVSKKMLQRRQYRRTRRSRKVRHRQARFDNRKQLMPPPSIRCKKDGILRVLKEISKRVKITRVIVEQGEFDISSMVREKKLNGVEYQQSEFNGKDLREKVLYRDGYKCQVCGGGEDLQIHHIIPKSRGGTDTLKNLITLCSNCHEKVHKENIRLDIKPKTFKYPAHLQVGKQYLLEGLKKIVKEIKTCSGWITAKWREKIGLEKTHWNDAIAMICRNYMPRIVAKPYLMIPKRAKVWESNPTKTCTEKRGFRHYDLVKAYHRTKGVVIGSIRGLKKSCITLRTSFDSNFPVGYTKTKLLWRFDGIIFIPEYV